VEAMKLTFLGLPDAEEAGVALVPAPLELTTCWKKGTWEAPFEILKVSPHLEFFDEEFLVEPYQEIGFFTYPVEELPYNLEEALNLLKEAVKEALRKKMFPILIGGEHTVSWAGFIAIKDFLKEDFKPLKVLHFDAHPDLRDEYLGTKLNHATVMRRILEEGGEILSVGIRTCSKEEHLLIQENGRVKVLWAREVKNNFEKVLEEIRAFLQDKPFYLSLDMDVFDPSLCPGVGTPEPGGLSWYEVWECLKVALVEGKPLGMDVVEVMPLGTHQITEYTAAKLIFKVASLLAWKRKKEENA
jgi:agmatinase